MDPTDTPPPTPSRSPRDWLAATILGGVTFAVFAPAVNYDFVNFDDPEYVMANPFVTRGLSLEGARWAFTDFHTFYWQPLTWLSLQLDAQLSWPKPFGFHLTNVLLHAGNAAWFFLALRALTGAFWRSGAAALVFALHPLRVESVAWVCERKDVLSVLFGLVAMWAYARYAARPSIGRYLVVLLAFLLSLMSKPMLVTLPFLLLVFDWWPLCRWSKQLSWTLVLEKLPFLAATAAVSSLVLFFGEESKMTAAAWQLIPAAARVENTIHSYAAYLGMGFWPTNLAIFYPHPALIYDGQGGLSRLELAVAVIVLASITAAAIVLRRRAPYLLTGWLWYVGTLVPVIGIWQSGYQSRADRYSYFPEMGIALAVCWGAAALIGPRWRVGALALAVLAAVLVVRTERQLTTWRDPVTLWEHARESVRISPQCLSHLGDALVRKGRDHDAAPVLTEALRLDPASAPAHINMANVYLHQGNLDLAAQHYSAACRFAPKLGVPHTLLAIVYLRLGKLAEAEQEHREAIRLAPHLAEAYAGLGEVELARGNLQGATRSYGKALELRPEDARARAYLGWVLFRSGKANEGAQLLRQAVRMNPELGFGHFFLGIVLSVTGDKDEATSHLQQAARQSPEVAKQVEELLRQTGTDRPSVPSPP
jgi:Tfp pilus assembly protein PilF